MKCTFLGKVYLFFVVILFARQDAMFPCGSCLGGCSARPVAASEELQTTPFGIAHKGLIASSFPENTMPAFNAACKSKLKGIEYDVRQTSDKKVVICHDDEVDRTSDGKGFVYEMTLKELQKLNFGINKGMDNVRIPLFEEVFNLCLANGKMQIIEIKDGASKADVEKHLIGKVLGNGIRDRVPEGKEVCDVVAAKIHEAHAEQTTKIGCFTIRILLYVHNKYPDIQTHLFIGKRNVKKYIKNGKLSVGKGDPAKCLASVKSVGVKAEYLTKTIVDGLHKRGLSVDAWGINTKDEFTRMKEIGVDSVTLEDETYLQED